MKIQLTDSLFIVSDSRQYILKRKVISEGGSVTESVLGYYGTIKQLVRGLIEKEIKSATVADLTSLTTYLDELEDRITSTFTKIGVKELLAENENNYKYIAQLERRNKRLEKQLKKTEVS